ncbi:MAG: 30S ribosomal protein S12 methylthiotransferase RimO [Bacillota bacterium]
MPAEESKSNHKLPGFSGVRIAAVSLGCSKNRIDTEEMLGLLAKLGFVLTDDYRNSDVVIVNTCSFIDQAQQESINKLLEISNTGSKSRPKIVAAGCLVELFGTKLIKSIPELDGAIGVHSYDSLEIFMKMLLSGNRPFIKKMPATEYSSLAPRILTTPAHSANVKIAEGCSNCCHYCLIPSIRGPYRSRTAEEIVTEVNDLLEKGTREINLIAQDTTAYGLDRKDLPNLPGLIRQILKSKHQFWLRIMYTYPSRIDDHLIDLIRTEKRICNYIDIPIQHVSDKVLKGMNRDYGKEELVKLLGKLRKRIPNLALRTTCMVGYPGEGRKQFEELLDFITVNQFERLGAFTYSSQENTIAASSLEKIPPRVVNKRHQELMLRQQLISTALNSKLIGGELTVLVDKVLGPGSGRYYGRTEYQAPEVDGGVLVRSQRSLSPGDLVSVKVFAASPYNLFARAY